MELWPNLFIVGPPKTGTTSLYRYLNSVPDIFLSSIKEPHYFSQIPLSNGKKFFEQISDKEDYLKLFKNAKDKKILVDASTSYFAAALAPELIYKNSPDARIIISLRDPVERTYSSYFWHRSYGRLRTTFHDELEFELTNKDDLTKPSLRLETGLYSQKLKKYLETFGPKQVKILIFEEWIKDVRNTINEIIKFLGLNYTLTDNLQNKYNAYEIPRGTFAQSILGNTFIGKVACSLFPQSTRGFLKNFFVKDGVKPKMLDEDRVKLVKFYQDDVRKVEKLLGRKLPWFNF